jgi:hypothetical protein
MTDTEFRALVKEMRAVQTEYFLKKEWHVLAVAKALEKAVDAELSNQLELFKDEG